MLSNTIPPNSTNKLHRWCVMEAVLPGDIRTRHVCAENPVGSFGLSTSAIQEFDAVAMTVKTLSGKIYTLVGPPEKSRLGAGAWRQWCSNNGVIAELDVTSDYLNVDPAPAVISFKRLDVRFRVYPDSELAG